MHYYLGILIFLFVLFGYMRFMHECWEYNFGKSLFLSVAAIMFLMSIFSFLDILLIGFWITSLFGFVYFWYSFLKSIIHKKNFFSFFATPAFAIFVIFLIVFMLGANKINIMMNWDECSYWGTMVKKLFHFNTYIGDGDFYSMYYPPALTSYNYFVVKFLGMQDSSIYFSQYFLIFSGIIFLIRNIKWKQIFIGICGVICGWLLLILLLRPFLLTIYSEIPLILLIGAAIILLFTAKKRIDYIFVAILLMCATLIKSNGIVACVVVMLMAFGQFIYLLIKNYRSKEKLIPYFFKQILENKYLFLVMVSPLIAQMGFNLFLNIHHISNPQSLNGGIIEFLKTFITDDGLTVKYLNALSTNYNYSPFNMSSIFLVALFIIGFIVLMHIHQEKEEEINKNKYIGFAYFFGFIIYAAALLYSYYFLFSRPEANVLASFDRYINTFVGAAGIGLLGLIIYYCFSNDKKITKKMTNYVVIITLLLFSVTNISELGKFVKQVLPFGSTPSVAQIEKGKEVALKYQDRFDSDDHIHFIAQGDYGMTIWATIYYMTPLKLYDPRFDGDNWSLRVPDSEETANTVVMSTDDYLAYLESKKFTDVIVIESSESFSKQYSSIFETDKDSYIKEGIYHFDVTNKKLVFEE